MKKILLPLVVVAALSLAGCSRNVNTNNATMMTGESKTENDVMMSGNIEMSGTTEKMMEDTMEKDDSEMMEKDDSMSVQSTGQYEAYSESAVAEALTEGKKVVLFFHASWCPSCRALNTEILSQMNTLPDNSVIFKVNYDTETALKKKYGITTQHTLVSIDSNMNLVDKSIGGDLSTIIGLMN